MVVVRLQGNEGRAEEGIIMLAVGDCKFEGWDLGSDGEGNFLLMMVMVASCWSSFHYNFLLTPHLILSSLVLALLYFTPFLILCVLAKEFLDIKNLVTRSNFSRRNQQISQTTRKQNIAKRHTTPSKIEMSPAGGRIKLFVNYLIPKEFIDIRAFRDTV